MFLRSAASVLFAAVSLALVACGGKSDEKQIDATVHSFFAAVKEKDVKKFCSAIVFTGPGRCETVIRVSGLRSNGDVHDVSVTDTKVSGDTATAKIRATSASGKKMSQNARFRKVDGTWKIQFGRGGAGP